MKLSVFFDNDGGVMGICWHCDCAVMCCFKEADVQTFFKNKKVGGSHSYLRQQRQSQSAAVDTAALMKNSQFPLHSMESHVPNTRGVT